MSYKVSLYQADIGGCGYMRVELVAKYINKILAGKMSASSPVTIEENLTNRLLVEPTNLPDMVSLQRVHTPEMLALLKHVRYQLNIPTVYELDDSIHHLHPHNPAYPYYFHSDRKTQVFKYLEDCIRACSAMTVSTEYLKKIYKKFNAHVYVLPNCLDYDVFAESNIRRHSHGDEIWIGWAGSVSHIPDLTHVAEAVRKILQEFPNTKLAIGGFDGHYQDARGVKRYLWEGIPYERTVKIHWTHNMKNYPSLLAHFDIALAPLVDIVFNRCKSNLKFLEYSACGVPVIASAVEPYAKTIKNGETGLLIPLEVSSKKDSISKHWYNAIKSLILNEHLRRQLSENAKAFVKQNYDMSTRIYDWLDVYSEVIERNKRDNLK